MPQPEVSRTEKPRAGYRPGVGVVLINHEDKVFVAQRIDMFKDAWQMPQGGIDEGEEPWTAALRELEEEIGTADAEYIGETEGWLSYDLPPELKTKAWQGRYLGQTQKWYVARFSGAESDIDLDTKHPEFSTWKWADLKALPAMIVDFKRPLYAALVEEFGPLVCKSR